MDQLRKKFKINKKQYDAGIGIIRDTLGSYESIAAQCFTSTGVKISGNCIRRWFNERSIPIEYAALFSDLTFGDAGVEDFYPWLDSYIH